jgi:pyruvate dehydrogenase E1 component alpha subunit
MRLPVLFVCEDNGLAVHTHKHARQGYKSISAIVSQFECSVFESDTTDVELIYHLTRDAIETHRKTGKPSFLHLKCYRYLEHVGVAEDFAAGYRPKNEFDEWYRRDCVALQRRKLLSQGMGEDALRIEEKQMDEQIERSVASAKAAAFPDNEELYAGVFHEKD